MVNKISVTILTKNSQKYIKECLQVLCGFDEIILLDNGSSDKTLTIAKQFKNVKIFENKFIGFGALKNLAIHYATNDWILSVDSDEILSKELVNEILNIKLENNTIYSILRENYYNKQKIKCCGWQNDWVNRLFNKKHTHFNNKKVHESLIIHNNTKLKKLHYTFKHYSFEGVSQLLLKMDTYSTLYAQEHKGKKLSSPSKALFRSITSFIKNYFFQKGFLYGYEGLLISISNANGVFYKYMKLYEENKNHDL